MICYELQFEPLARAYRRAGAEFLVNITNDAWYGRTAGPYQHATHLVMRAIETRAGIARAANDGISELVDPLGRTSIETGLEQDAAVAGLLRTSDVIPLYVRWGDWVGTLVVVATLGFVAKPRVATTTSVPTQSPQRTYSGITSLVRSRPATAASCSKPVSIDVRPSGSTSSEMPSFAARAIPARVSIARITRWVAC